jgi:outer membrane biosynthesis protein TonB
MVVGSALLHAGALGLVLASPKISDREPPRVISVELIAPAAPAAPAAAPKPAPAPPPEAAAPPPPPETKQIVLPEKPQAPKPPEKAAKPKPREKEVFKEPPKKQEKNLDDLLAEMRGSEKTPPAPTPSEAPVNSAVAPSPAPSAGTAELSPEEAAWRSRVIRKMKGIWVVPPGFRTQPLQTRVLVTLDASGNIVGTPQITKKSGNPWYDEGVVRGLAKASPLPPPPEAGDWPLWFEPGDSL